MVNKTAAARRFKRNYRKGTWRYHIASYYAGYPLEFWNRIKQLPAVKNSPDSKFVIFTSGRSGSTLLVDLLNSNPLIQCDLELLKRRVAFPLPLVRSFEQQSEKPVYGWKLLSYQLLNVQTGVKDKKAFFEQLIQKENYKLIYLTRGNKVKQALSIIYAFYRGTWHNKEGSEQRQIERFEMDPKIFHHFLKEVDILDKFEKEMIADIPHLFLTYEDNLKEVIQHELTIKHISDYLNIEAVKPDTSLRRVTPSKLENMISNKQQVIKYLANTDYAHYVPTLEKM